LLEIVLTRAMEFDECLCSIDCSRGS